MGKGMENIKEFNLFWLSKYRSQLMGLAICMVVFHHLTFRTSAGIIGKAYMFLRVTGAVGVDIFLFLSAIGLWFSFSRNQDIKSFYRKRVLRIIPTYLIITVPYYIYTDIVVAHSSLSKFFEDVTLIQYWTRGGGDWYIAAIIVLYMLFPLMYKVTFGLRGGVQHAMDYMGRNMPFDLFFGSCTFS